MSTTEPYVRTSRPVDGVAQVTLSRPDRRNAFSLEDLDELAGSLRRVADDEQVGAVILAAEGPSFCAGADLTRVHNRELGAQSQPGLGISNAWEVIETLSLPVIAAVQGHAVGGGFHLASCCDLIVAAASARFRDPHAALGLLPTSGEHQKYSRRLGLYRTRELMFTSRTLTAERAFEWGLVTSVVPDEELLDRALDLAVEIASNNRRAVSYLKQMLNRGHGQTYGEARWDDALVMEHGAINRGEDPDRERRLEAMRNRRSAPPTSTG